MILSYDVAAHSRNLWTGIRPAEPVPVQTVLIADRDGVYDRGGAMVDCYYRTQGQISELGAHTVRRSNGRGFWAKQQGRTGMTLAIGLV